MNINIYIISASTINADGHGACEGGGLSSQACLDAVKILMADEDRYWFGNSFLPSCPNRPPFLYLPTCSNNDRVFKSIITRARNSSDSSVNTITKVLNVTFETPRGEF